LFIWFLLSSCLLISIFTVELRYSTILALFEPCNPSVIMDPPLSSDLTFIPDSDPLYYKIIKLNKILFSFVETRVVIYLQFPI
jgi:hypothetical protein